MILEDSSSSELYKNRVRSMPPILYAILTPNSMLGYMLGSWNVAHCFQSLWPSPQFLKNCTHSINPISFGPRRERACLRGFRQCEFQTSLLSYRDQLENLNSTSVMCTYITFQKPNSKGADQSARMRRLVCVFVVRKPPKTGFLAPSPILGRSS